MSKANAKHELQKLVRQRLKGVPEGQEMCVLCHPDRKTDAEDFAKSVSDALPTGESIGVVTDKDCPADKYYIVNRDYYDEFAEQPWKVMH